MRVPLLLSTVVSLSACLAGEPATSEEVGAIEVVLAEPPADATCLALTLVNQDEVALVRHAALAGALRIPDLPLGAYQVSARAYAALDCADEPFSAPWVTLRPATVIVTRAAPQLEVTLYRANQVGGRAQFVEAPEVVAVDQPRIYTIVSDVDWLAWNQGPWRDDGSIWALHDDTSGWAQPEQVASGQRQPRDLTIHPFGAVAWTRAATAGPASGGISDWDIGRAPRSLAEGQAPGAIAAGGGLVYWIDGDASIRAVDAFGPPAAHPPITGQAWPSALAADATHVYWSTDGDRRLWRAAHGQTAPSELTALAPDGRGVTSLTVAGDELVWADTDGEERSSVIWRAPSAGGGAPRRVFPASGRFPAISSVKVLDGFVYFVALNAAWRVPVAGGAHELIQDGAVTSLTVTAWGGRRWLYWADRELGGVVWRQRLD